MAQSGFTPIILLNSTTTGNSPTTSNLVAGELAINIADGKLFFNKSGTITTMANASLQIAGGSPQYAVTLTATGATNVTLPTSGYVVSSVTQLGANPVTGTPSSTTFLRGDGTWATAGASQATATALGAVYAKQTTGGGTPFLTAFGYNAGVSTTGVSNTAIGTQALYTNSTGTYNTVSGYQAAYTTTSGFNTIYGAFAGYYVTGTNNSYFGYAAGSQNSTASGSNNVGIGHSALFANTTASNNTAVGYQAGYSNSTGTGNNAFGYSSLYNNTGNYNIAVGNNVLYYNTSGGNNTAVGHGALQSNTTASDCTAIGYQALYSHTTGGDNTAVGYGAAYLLTTGSLNTCIGENSGYSLTTGYRNTFLGHSSGNGGFGAAGFTTGSYNTSLGLATGCSSGNVTNSIVISGSYADVDKGSSTGFINPNGGGVYQGNNSATWNVSSDQRLKKNIVDNNVGLDKVIQIQVRNFEYRTVDEIIDLPKHSAIKKQGVQLGVIAQELQQVLPDCVKQESTGVLAVDSTDIMYHLINAIKELNAKVTALEAKLGA